MRPLSILTNLLPFISGTADSTIPSPPIQRRRHNPYADHPEESPYALPVPVRDEEILHIPHSLVKPTGSRRSDPASPKALARLLADLSPRHSPAVLDDFEDVEALPELSPTLASDPSECASDSLGLSTGTEGSPLVHDELPAVLRSRDAEDEDVEPLRQSLKGLYALWKLKRSANGVASEEEARASFLRVVEDVIGS